MKKIILVSIAMLASFAVQAQSISNEVAARVILRQIVSEQKKEILAYGGKVTLKNIKSLLDTPSGKTGPESITHFECSAEADRSQNCEISVLHDVGDDEFLSLIKIGISPNGKVLVTGILNAG